MGYIDLDKSNPMYLVASYCKKAGLKLSESNGADVKYGFILGLKELLLLNLI